ncbi:MAG: FAD-dependent oxidoreductase, partial [Polymorphobacter sp.]
MAQQFDLLIIGGGVLGAFHAYHALEKGYRVALLERNSSPQGSSVQNFGQIVPSGMDRKWQQYGRVSLEIYKEIQSKFDISVRQNGSVQIKSNKIQARHRLF